MKYDASRLAGSANFTARRTVALHRPDPRPPRNPLRMPAAAAGHTRFELAQAQGGAIFCAQKICRVAGETGTGIIVVG